MERPRAAAQAGHHAAAGGLNRRDGVIGEARVAREYLELRRSPLWSGAERPAGDGRQVLLVGGFGVPASTLAPLRRWLRGGGYDAQIAPLGLNVDCTERSVERLAASVTGPVTLVGHSRGGLQARVLAVRRPAGVDRLVTVATPWIVGPPPGRGIEVTASLVRRTGLVPSIDCATGACCDQVRADVARRPRARWTLLWSSRDEVAGERSQPAAAVGPADDDLREVEAIDVGTTHLGAVLSVAGWRAIAAALR